MRTVLLGISGLVALVFGAAFGATFVARDRVTGLAQGYVVDRTLAYADPLVGLADEALRAPGIKLLLKDDQLRIARQEVAEYRREPRSYIVGLVAAGGAPPAAAPGPDAPIQDRVLSWKGEIRTYFGRVLGRLLLDLRIFTGSNLAAALVAFGLAVAARRERLPRLLPAAGLLLVSTGYMTYVYVDEFSYFKILMNWRMGWWYPALLALTFLGAYAERGRTPAPADAGTAEGGTPTA